MSDEKKVTERIEEKTETKNRWGSRPDGSEGEYRKEVSVKTERKEEKDKDDKDEVIVIEE
jgi:hypothetical protein